ncbi:MAG: SCO6745 family protein [Actinomycetota bacterium]
MSSLAPLARRFLGALEPIATMPWFSAETFDELKPLGYEGWGVYFCSRAAPLGAIDPELAIALFYNWNPAMIRRELKWSSSPEDARAAYERAVRKAFDRVVAPAVDLDSVEINRAALLLQEATSGCELEGRPIFASYSRLQWPTDPAISLWHGATLLREYRGDTHNAILVSHGLSPIEALLLNANWVSAKLELYLGSREWTLQDAQPFMDALREKGFLDAEAKITEGGLKFREMVEVDTDRRSIAPIETLGPSKAEEVLSLIEPVSKAILEAKAVPSLVGRVARGHR